LSSYTISGISKGLSSMSDDDDEEEEDVVSFIVFNQLK
jgi:hypothetical protein